MLAPHVRKKVDDLWNRFWAAGITNPLVAVEQITYLLFLKRLEDIDQKRMERGLRSIYAPTVEEEAEIRATSEDSRSALNLKYDAARCRWSYIRQEKTNPTHLIENVFPWLRTIEQRLTTDEGGTELASLNNRMADAYFQLDPNKGKVLSDAIDAIDQLFASTGEGSAAQDIMGDTFEYLLNEVATAGKNGQFRTPRHLIRFMVELLDPEPGDRIIDPAAGTGGFLFSSQQYLMRKYSAAENVLIEWDGTPHRTDGAAATPAQYEAIHNGSNFVGIDNDRTMSRIGWMNLVLHDIIDPRMIQGDALSKRDGKPQLAELLRSETYNYVLANPPFTGTVDGADLEKDSKLFPRAAEKGKRRNDVITNRSELLFVWLMLDLLQVGGRCAVIVPEGVLFGNTDAHVRLRRELLTEHYVEAVISLPTGMFLPYTGVKTSILVFRKETAKVEKQSSKLGAPPRTDRVWFYEVEEDAHSRDAKRYARPHHQNDFWDALIKFRLWLSKSSNSHENLEKTLFQPSLRNERWRQALLRDSTDSLTPAGRAFASLPDAHLWDGKVWGNHELFDDLPIDPVAAEAHVTTRAGEIIFELAIQAFFPVAEQLWHSTLGKRLAEEISDAELVEAWRKQARPIDIEFRKAAREREAFFEREASFALPLWRELIKEALSKTQEPAYIIATLHHPQPPTELTAHDVGLMLDEAAREVAKVEGFDVTLRSLAIDQESELKTAKHWLIPVRAWAVNENWRSDDGSTEGSHGADGNVRDLYVEHVLSAGLYNDKGALKDGLLDPDCIEARGWNLSAGQYKPFDFTQLKSERNVAQMVDDITRSEHTLIERLEKLRAMVEGIV